MLVLLAFLLGTLVTLASLLLIAVEIVSSSRQRLMLSHASSKANQFREANARALMLESETSEGLSDASH